MVGSAKQPAMAAFYEKVFGKKPDMVEEDWAGWIAGKSFFAVGKHSKIKGQTKEPDRIIFNFETKEVKKEFERIKSLGAKVVKAPYKMGSAWIATLADPDGNYFQLMTPWEG